MDEHSTGRQRHRQSLRQRLPVNAHTRGHSSDEFRGSHGRSFQHELRPLPRHANDFFAFPRRICAPRPGPGHGERSSVARPAVVDDRLGHRYGCRDPLPVERLRLSVWDRAVWRPIRVGDDFHNASFFSPRLESSGRTPAAGADDRIPVYIHTGRCGCRGNHYHDLVGARNAPNDSFRVAVAGISDDRLSVLETRPKHRQRHCIGGIA